MIHALVKLNNDFYHENLASFSSTRMRGWDGWNRVVPYLGIDGDGCHVLDAACGNLRFERFVRETYPLSGARFTCIDSCEELASPPVDGASFRRVDIIERLLSGAELSEERFDAAVSFGFTHHVPTNGLRAELLRALLKQVNAGGTVAISFWKFANDERLARQARATTEIGVAELGLALDEGDYLLGWDAQPGVYRYCHSFTDDEIGYLLQSIGPLGYIEDRFSADGRNGALNGYAIIRRR